MQRKQERLFCRIGRHNLIPLSFKVILKYLTDILFVVYNKYFHTSHAFS